MLAPGMCRPALELGGFLRGGRVDWKSGRRICPFFAFFGSFRAANTTETWREIGWEGEGQKKGVGLGGLSGLVSLWWKSTHDSAAGEGGRKSRQKGSRLLRLLSKSPCARGETAGGLRGEENPPT